MKKIVLASQSPRRKELLARIGVSFEVDVANIDETLEKGLDLEEQIKELAYRKAKAVQERHPQDVIIGSDTIVTFQNKILGKPKNHDEAKAMLKMLSNQTHQVITGVCILDGDDKDVDVSVSDVTFIELSDEEINDYVASNEADDKAGAYGIQGKAGCFVKHISGDYYAIMGFPISMVYQKLKAKHLV